MTALTPPVGQDAGELGTDTAVRRRIGWIWTLLFLNVLSFSPSHLVLPIPGTVGKSITQGALWLALVLALTINRRVLLRPNAYLVICTVLAAVSLVVSVRTFHLGSTYRAVRLVGFMATLWLLTPWFGRRDMLLLRCHLRCLLVVTGVTVVGIVLSPHKAFAAGRLQGDIWPIPSTQLAHYAAVTAGLGVVLWFCGLIRRNSALAIIGFGLTVLILTHTRTALTAIVAAVVVAGASLLLAKRRVRRTLAAAGIVICISATAFGPSLSHWFLRGESSTLFTTLSGRTVVWNELVNTPRDKGEVLFGDGLSNKSFNGLSIDNSWLAAYQDQGLVGDVLIGLFLLALLLAAVRAPRGPSRALALMLLTYCIIASYTEVGLGDASTYLLDLTIAASLLVRPGWARLGAETPPP